VKTVNQFDEGGNFILWSDDIGEGYSRQGAISKRIIQGLLWHVLDDGKSLDTFPQQYVTRKVWGEILAQFRETQHREDCHFEVLDIQLKEQPNG
jgi:hypothetical protein